MNERTHITDAVAVVSEACRRDERVRAQVEQMIVPLMDAIRVVADVWSRLPIEARMEIERMARSEEDAHNTMRQLAKEGEAYKWDWFDEHDSYGVRRGSEIVRLTGRANKGYERAVALVAELNAWKKGDDRG